MAHHNFQHSTADDDPATPLSPSSSGASTMHPPSSTHPTSSPNASRSPMHMNPSINTTPQQNSHGGFQMSHHNFNNNNNNSNQPNNPASSQNQGHPTVTYGTLPVFKDEDQEFDPNSMLIDYSQKDFQPVKFREEILQKLLITLTTHKHPNILLTGEAGVGKTAIVEELVRRLKTKDPLTVHMLDPQTKIYELQVGTIVAGSSLVGDLEKKLKQVMQFISDPQNHAILYIDEIHQIVSDHDPENNKISQILKPALARGDMHVIGSTTTQEARDLMKDPAFKRRFSQVLVPELSDQDTSAILQDLIPTIQQQDHVQLTPALCNYITKVANQYARAYQSHRPDTALTVLDQACSLTKLNAFNQQLQFQQTLTPPATLPLTEHLIDKAALNLLNTSESLTKPQLNTLIHNLKTNIIGQTDAKDALIKDLQYQMLNLTHRNKPHSYLFAGPTGTGKTEVAKQLAANLFGSTDRLINLNMTEYASSMSLTRLIGSSRGYAGSESHQPLPLDPLINNPFQIVLLDEFEKASKPVQRLFMQALDEGYLKLQNDDLIDFSHAIVIATTNAGANTDTNHVGFNEKPHATTSDLFMRLHQAFPPELLNRFEHIIMFDSLSRDEYAQILKLKYNQLIKQINENRPDLAITPTTLASDQDYDFIDHLAQQTYNRHQNGRPAARTIYRYIADQLLQHPDQTQFNFDINLSTNQIARKESHHAN